MKQPKPVRMSEWESSKRVACLNLIKVLLMAVQTALFMVPWFSFYQANMLHPYYYWGNWVMCGVFMTLYLIFARLYGGLQINTARAGEIAYSLAIGSVFTYFIIYCVICLLSYRLVSPLPLLACWAVSTLFSALWAMLAVRLNNHLFPPKRVCIVYDNEDAYESAAAIRQLSWKFQVTGSWNIDEGLGTIFAAIQNSEAVFLCGLRSSTRNTILKFCIAHSIEAYIRPKIGDILVSSANRVHLMNLPFLHCTRNNRSYWYRIAKRAMDVVISALALVAASPVMLISAIAIRCCDGGPVFYRQCRLTENGRTFDILKFRSMRVDAEKDGVARLASEHDDRVTPVGKILRKYRVDELPQFINILKGEMSVVGPRPERPEIAAQYEELIPEFRLRLQVKAGLTGYAQVYGKYNTNPYDKLEMDLMYIAKPSILQDIALLFATVKILFQAESTEGVSEGQATAVRDESDKLSV